MSDNKKENNEVETETQLIKDEKVSLVDSLNYQPSRYNHFMNNNTNPVIDYKPDYNQTRINELNTFPYINKIQNQDTKKNEEKDEKLNKALTQIKEKEDEIKKITQLFDDLTEEYKKLTTKHNALMIYASDLQKKCDSLESELAESKKKEDANEYNKLIKEKDNIISILQNEMNFYKEQFEKNKLGQKGEYKDSNQIEKKLNELIDSYIKENKNLKQKLKDNHILKKDYKVIENKMNNEIENFNNIITQYNNKLIDAVSKITYIFENEDKKSAAQFLVDQINEFMKENQNLINENTKLKCKIGELESDNVYTSFNV